MFRSLSGERHLTGGQSSPPQAGLDVTSPGLLSQESPWIGLLSLVSRPAVALLQQLLPAALRGGPECSAEAESEFFRQLADMKSPPPLTHLSGQQGGGAGLSVDSLRELGLQSSEETDAQLRQQPPGGHLSSARTFLSQAGLSAQEIRPPHGWLRGRPWWGSLWGGEESSGTGLLSDVIWAGEGAGTGRLCPQQAETKAPPAPVFVGGWTLGENTGPTYHKEGPANNGGLHTVQNTGGSAPDLQLSTRAVCRGGAGLTPDQDNGYSSLEEEHFQMCVVMYMGGAASTKPSAAVRTDMEGGASEEGASSSGHLEEEEEEEEEEKQGPSRGCQSGGVEVVSGPQCQNKAIAFIMGCPCSDDDSSQSESSDEEDDDGFDSEGSSELSDSSDDDDDDDDEDDDEDEAAGSEGDSEADRLWNSLCQSADPYNPRNFTARLHTGSSPPRAVPPSTPLASAQSSPASSPDLAPLPLSSPPSGPDAWDDSTSASEADEAESVRLWSSFSSSDPYSPFNFQAPLRTRAAPQVGPRAKARAKKASQTPSCPPYPDPASPPGYRKEEAEERLDSGFSEPGGSQRAKKVRFCDDVEEFFASCGEEEEDRRGPWEELARDRCRFLRRCQEVELSIAYCLQPQHRSLVYRRLTVLCTQDA